MKRANWVWWTTEPLLRRLYIILGFLAAVLLVIFILVVVFPSNQDSLSIRYTLIQQCVGTPTVSSYQRSGLAEVLNSPNTEPSACWHQVKLPLYFHGSLDGPSHTNRRGSEKLSHTWLRLQYNVPANWPKNEPLMIYVPRVMGSAWQVQVDGVVLADNLDDWRMMWNRPIAVRVSPVRFVPDQTIHINIGIAYLSAVGHSVSRVTLGPASEVGRLLAWREYLQYTIPQACGVVLLLLGTFFFAFWLVRRTETAHLLLSLASLAWFVSNLQYVLPRHDEPLLDGWYDGIVSMSVAWFMLLVYLFVLQFDQRRWRWLEWGLPIFVVIMTILALPWWGLLPVNGGLWFQVTNAAVATVVTFSIGSMAWHGGSIELRVISITLFCALLAGTHDVALLAQLVHPESVYLLPYSGLLVFGSFLFAVQRRYVHAIDEHEKLSATLAERVAQREAELIKSHQRLRELEREQVLAGERQRLMRDIHDGIGSALTSSLVAVERGRATPQELAAMLRECVDDLRTIIDSLEPCNNDLISLLATLRFRLGRRLEVAGTRVEWKVNELPALSWLGPAEALQVMRIIQELLTNIIKHANANCVEVSTRTRNNRVDVCISDDGCGFDILSTTAGRGLPVLKQRAINLKGELVITSHISEGTFARLSLPIHQMI